MIKKGGIISKIDKGSLAESAGLNVGDKIIEVNDMPVNDLIDLNFALSDEEVNIIIEDSLGNKKTHYFQKRFDDSIGIELEKAVFDSVRQCANNCVFCFIDQMPEGLRESLYVKDDDYRMSFLHGNYITMTNMGERDFKRIRSFNLSPLYVSVHTMNPNLRQKMMNHRSADKIVEYLKSLEEWGIDVHVQIVMCPGYNDGEELLYTLNTLYNDYSNIIDVAVVPVGLSKYRDGLPTLVSVDKAKAIETINIVKSIQEKAQKERNNSFVYLADEFYLKAEIDYPEASYYDDFPLLEDGIGMGRKFELDWHKYKTEDPFNYDSEKNIVLITGAAIGEKMSELVAQLNIKNMNVTVLPIENEFFGKTINVTGLLTATDIIRGIKKAEIKRGKKFEGVIIPGVCLRKGVPVFLDDMTIDQVSAELNCDVRICHFATDLLEQLYHWR